jgi:hypothetical protein
MPKKSPPDADLGKKPTTFEDRVVVCFSLLALVGSAALYWLKMPSIMISIFLSAGITAVVYRFLGGIERTEIFLGTVKLTGTIAAMVALAVWIDGTKQLDPEFRFHLVSEDVIVGKWNWKAVFPGAGWDGDLEFKKTNGQLTFDGKEYLLEKGPSTAENHKLSLEMTNGKASFSSDRTKLYLESDVRDLEFNRKFHWKSVEPLVLIPAFSGLLTPERPDDPNLESKPYGILITKNSAR